MIDEILFIHKRKETRMFVYHVDDQLHLFDDLDHHRAHAVEPFKFLIKIVKYVVNLDFSREFFIQL